MEWAASSGLLSSGLARAQVTPRPKKRMNAAHHTRSRSVCCMVPPSRQPAAQLRLGSQRSPGPLARGSSPDPFGRGTRTGRSRTRWWPPGRTAVIGWATPPRTLFPGWAWKGSTSVSRPPAVGGRETSVGVNDHMSEPPGRPRAAPAAVPAEVTGPASADPEAALAALVERSGIRRVDVVAWRDLDDAEARGLLI